MGLSVPGTFADGSVVSAAGLSTIPQAINDLSRVATGQAAVNAGAGQPFLKAYLTSPQPIPNAALIPVQPNAFYTNVSGMWNASYPYTIVVTQAGWYRVEAQAAWDTGAVNTERRLSISVDGGISMAAATNATISSAVAINHRMQTSALVKLPAGGQVSVYVWQNTGAALNLLAASATSTTATWGTCITMIYETAYF